MNPPRGLLPQSDPENGGGGSIARSLTAMAIARYSRPWAATTCRC